MSPVTQALARVHEIQATLAELRVRTASATAVTASTAAGTAGAVTGGTADGFATALATQAGAAGTTGASGAATAPRGTTTAAVGALTEGTGVGGDDVVAAARKYLGVPYVLGGEDTTGMDCSGLVQRVFADLGVAVPRVVPDQARLGVEVPSLAEARPGDLVVSRGTGHIAIWLGDGKLLHAPRPGKDVQIVDNYLRETDVTTIRRLVPDGAGAATAGAATAGARTTGAAEGAAALAALQRLTLTGVAS